MISLRDLISLILKIRFKTQLPNFAALDPFDMCDENHNSFFWFFKFFLSTFDVGRSMFIFNDFDEYKCLKKMPNI